MKVFIRLGQWIRFFDRWVFIRLVRLTGFLMGIVGVRALTVVFRALTCLPLVRLLTVPLWRRVLLNSGFRVRSAEWMRWVANCWPTPKHQVLSALTLMEARHFRGVQELLRSAKAALQKHPRNSASYFDIVDIEAMLAIENGVIAPDTVLFAKGRGTTIADFCYHRAWDAHAVLNGKETSRFLDCYFRLVDYDPDLVFRVSDVLVVPNGLWKQLVVVLKVIEARLLADQEEIDIATGISNTALGRLEAMFRIGSRRERKQDTLFAVRLRLVRAYIEMGCFDLATEVLARCQVGETQKSLLHGLILLHDPSQDSKLGQKLLIQAYADKKLSNTERSAIAGEIAVSFEESRDFDTARQYYVSSFYVGGIPYYLPEYLWRYVSLCMAQGDWGEAAHVLRAGLRVSWNGFRKLAKVPIEKRLRRNRLIPTAGAFFLGCWGIGDDIIRIGMFTALHDVEHGPKFGFSVDPRILSLYERSFPQFEFVAISRRYGPFGMSEEEYVRLRDGVPPHLDRGRLDINILKAIRRYPELSLTEDMLVAFIQAGPTICRPDTPMLKVMPEKAKSAQEWLNTLPPGINVGISWRSGQRDVMRDKSYTDVVRDWGNVLSVKGVNFINLQYSWEEDELSQAEVRHGCRIHMMPGVDLKDDIEDIVALAYVLDVVIAPGTTVRDMCAAAGARVWALSTTPVLPDLWRLQEDGERDRLFPSMIHITSFRYGDAKGALAEVASRLSHLSLSAKNDAK